VWSSGDALIGGTHHLFGLSENDGVLGIAYGLFAVLVLVVCIYGFRFMLWINKIAVFASSTMFLLGILPFTAYLTRIIAEVYNWDRRASGSLCWLNAVDHEQPDLLWRFPRRLVALYSKRNLTLSYHVGCICRSSGDASTVYLWLMHRNNRRGPCISIHRQQQLRGGLLAVTPGWFFLPVCVIAIVGGLSTGTTALYGTGLDMSSIFPRLLSRVQATLLIGIIAIAFIFIGRFAFNLVQSVSTFAVLIVTCTSPWMVIMIIGMIACQGAYHSDDLHVFSRGQRGGRYWFHHGWNWRGLGAWIPSAIVGLCLVNIPGQFVGPLGELAGGIDVSLPVTLGLAALLYLVLLRIFPEQSVLTDSSSKIYTAKTQGGVQ
jgi:purine-cytosine permease-like protein